jgi:hypothetical protein
MFQIKKTKLLEMLATKGKHNPWSYSAAIPHTAMAIPFIYSFLWELRSLSPNFHIHVTVSDLYIPRIGPHISSRRKGRPIVEIYNSLTDT